jgi:hypothetical protein
MPAARDRKLPDRPAVSWQSHVVSPAVAVNALTGDRMTIRRSTAALAVMAAFGFASCAAGQKAPPALERIDREHLCVTSGAVSAISGGRLAIEAPSSRAVAQNGSGNDADQVAEIRFQYLGPSQASKPLASGELRRQIGLKLRAQDSCNLIYAMWRIEPEARIAVSIKRNVGLRTNEQCGVRGYRNFKEQDQSPPPILPGEAHTLGANLHGRDLTVTADGKAVWQGSLGGEIALPVGPPGFRTDNARFVLEYLAGAQGGSRRPGQARSPAAGRCVMSEGD